MFKSCLTLVPIHLALDNRDEAHRWLQKCVEDHTPPTTLLCVPGPLIYELLDEPRFREVLRRLQLPKASDLST